MGELVLGMVFNGHIAKWIEGYENVHGGNGIGKRNVEGKMLFEFCDEKELCVANTWFRKGEKRKVTYNAGGNESDLYFVLVGKGNRKYPRDLKVIPSDLQHRFVVVVLVKKKVKKVVRKEAIETRKVWKLKEDNTRARFEERVGELVSADAPDLWKCFREVMLKAIDEVCGKTKRRRDQGDTWWNKDVKEAIARKKDAHKVMCKSRTEANKARYKSIKNQAKKVVAKAMREAAKQEMRELREKSE